MADQTVKIDLSVEDTRGTMRKRTDEGRAYNKELERSESLLKKTMGPSASSVREYGQARGAAGVTGASARDFAKESEGLGGLVRLYATYAANIYAVSAAFGALRDAMQTDVMSRSLDLLGARTGTALGGMAKQLVAVTDGAISFREAMEATGKAVSAGLNKQQFTDLGIVAKGASQALGLNMSDAISRLSRGITKLEPELLDELGLFTKLGKSTEDYARSIGKSEAQLTDFERRQAFANAVLKEGKDKFADIAQESNVYDKLLAQLKNVAQGILSVVNTAILPIAKLFADNSTLIGAAIAAFTLKLTKDALPVLGQWREKLQATAIAAREESEKINLAFQEAFAFKSETDLGLPVLRDKVIKATADLKIAQDKLAKSTPAELKGAAFKQATTEAELSTNTRAKLEADISRFTATGAAHMKDYAEASKDVLAADARRVALAKELEALEEKSQEGLQKRARVGSELWQREQIASDARSKAASLEIRAKVGENVDRLGVIGGIGELYNTTMATRDLGKLDKFKTIALGTFSAVVRGVEIFAQSLSKAFFYLEIAIVTFGILDSVFSTNEKAISKFKQSVDELDESIKNTELVAQKFKDTLTYESIIAYTNSLQGLSEALEKTNADFKQAVQESSTWNKFWDSVKDVTPFVDSIRETAGKRLSKSIIDAINLAPVGEARDALRNKYKSMIVIDSKLPFTAKNIESALDNLKDAEFDQTFDRVTEATKETNKIWAQSSNVLKQLKEDSEATAKSFSTLANSVKDKSPLTEFLTNNLKQANSLQAALSSDNIYTQAGAADFLSRLSELKPLDPAVAKSVAENTIEFNKLTTKANEYRTQIYDITKKIEETSKSRSVQSLAVRPIGPSNFQANRLEEAATPDYTKTLSEAKAGLKDVEDKLKSVTANLAKNVADSAELAVKLFFQKSNLELRKLAIDKEKLIVSFVPEVKTKEAIERRADLEKESISIEQKLFNIQSDLVIAQEKSTLQMAQLTAQLEKNEIQAKLNTMMDGDTENIKKLQARDTELTKSMSANSLILKAMEGGASGVAALMKSPEGASMTGKLSGLFSIYQEKKKKAQEAENRRLDVDMKKDADQAVLVIEDKIKSLQDTYDTINQSLSALATGPEADTFKDSVQLILGRLKDQQELLKFDETLAKLNVALQAAKTVKGPAGAKDEASILSQIQKQTTAKDVKALQQQEAQGIATVNAQRAKTIRDLEQEVRLKGELAEASKAYILGTGLQAEKSRIQIDQDIRAIQSRLAFEKEEQRLAAARKLQVEAQEAVRQLGPMASKENAANPQAYAAKAAVAQAKLTEAEEAKANVEADRGARIVVENSKRYTDAHTLRMKAIDEEIGRLQAQQLIEQTLRDISTDRLTRENDLAQFRLDRQIELLQITDQDAKAQKIRLADVAIELNLKKQLADIDAQILMAEENLRREKAAQGGGPTAEDLFSGVPEVPSALAQRQAEAASLKLKRQGYIDTAEAAKNLSKEQLELFGREGAYTDAVKNGFKAMEDALVEFAKTGKLSFKSMIDSFLTDLLRYEIRQQQLELFKGFGGASGIAKSIMGFMGFGPTNINANAPSPDAAAMDLFSAKGNAFDKGYPLHKFAMGAAFTNSIVNSPTLFKFAQGTGLMGEAGPEAVMPLKRDSDGNLGVRSQPSNVNVVVNNHTGQPAKTNETIDSRGNRTIEVIVGDVVAQQIATKGSPIQQSMSNTYGNKPALARR